MLHTVWNKSWQQHPTKKHLYGYLRPITQTIQVRRRKHLKVRMNSYATFSYGLLHMDTPVLVDQQKTYIRQLSADTIGTDCVCVCVCVSERERERERESVCVCVSREFVFSASLDKDGDSCICFHLSWRTK